MKYFTNDGGADVKSFMKQTQKTFITFVSKTIDIWLLVCYNMGVIKENTMNYYKIKKQFESYGLGDGTYILDSVGTSVTLNGGYQVSFEESNNPLDEQAFNEYANEYATYFKPYIGVWDNQVELSFHIKDKDFALAMAKQFNQVAIWDWENKKPIYL